MKKFVKQKGSAMISALLMMSIVTVITVAMISRQDIEIRRTESVMEQQRLINQVAVVELWAIETIKQVAKDLTPETDYITLEQLWTTPLPEFKQEGIWLKGEIYDLQSLFNINNLLVDLVVEEATPTEEKPRANETTPPSQPPAEENKEEVKRDPFDEKTPFTTPNMFARLLMNSAELKQADAIALTESILHWTSPDMTEQDNIYLEARAPYRPAHQAFISVSELRLVHGITSSIYNAIHPYLSAIPLSIEPTPAPSQNMIMPVNVNTTEIHVLAAIANIELDEAKNILNSRPYFDMEGIQSQLEKLNGSVVDISGAMKMLSVTSNYFLVRAYAWDEKRQVIQYSILHRSEDGKVRVIYRIQGEM